MRNEVLSCFDAVIRSLSSLNLIRAELYFIFSLTWAPIGPLSILQALSIYTTGRSELFMTYLPSCKRCLNMVDWFETFQRDSHRHMQSMQYYWNLISARSQPKNTYKENTIPDMQPFLNLYRLAVQIRLPHFTVNFMLAFITLKKRPELTVFSLF